MMKLWTLGFMHFKNAKEGFKKNARYAATLSEDDTCDICGDQSRNSQIICVCTKSKGCYCNGENKRILWSISCV